MMIGGDGKGMRLTHDFRGGTPKLEGTFPGNGVYRVVL